MDILQESTTADPRVDRHGAMTLENCSDGREDVVPNDHVLPLPSYDLSYDIVPAGSSFAYSLSSPWEFLAERPALMCGNVLCTSRDSEFF